MPIFRVNSVDLKKKNLPKFFDAFNRIFSYILASIIKGVHTNIFPWHSSSSPQGWIECCRNMWSKVWVVNGWRIVFICSSSAIHTRALKTWPVVDPSDGCAQPQDGCALGSTAGKVWLRHSGVSVLYRFMHWRDLDSSPPIKDPLAEHHSQAVFSWWGPVQKS